MMGRRLQKGANSHDSLVKRLVIPFAISLPLVASLQDAKAVINPESTMALRKLQESSAQTIKLEKRARSRGRCRVEDKSVVREFGNGDVIREDAVVNAGDRARKIRCVGNSTFVETDREFIMIFHEQHRITDSDKKRMITAESPQLRFSYEGYFGSKGLHSWICPSANSCHLLTTEGEFNTIRSENGYDQIGGIKISGDVSKSQLVYYRGVAFVAPAEGKIWIMPSNSSRYHSRPLPKPLWDGSFAKKDGELFFENGQENVKISVRKKEGRIAILIE